MKPPARETDERRAADEPPYEVEFFEDADGTEPALAFMRSLASLKKRAIGVAINEVLADDGPDVAEGNMGRNLGGGRSSGLEIDPPAGRMCVGVRQHSRMPSLTRRHKMGIDTKAAGRLERMGSYVISQRDGSKD